MENLLRRLYWKKKYPEFSEAIKRGKEEKVMLHKEFPEALRTRKGNPERYSPLKWPEGG